ncbi:MAG: hypothetical protein R3D02_08965 [Hyphomicrobiales bacterium]
MEQIANIASAATGATGATGSTDAGGTSAQEQQVAMQIGMNIMQMLFKEIWNNVTENTQ